MGSGIDEVLTMTRSSTDYYYHYDGLNSVRNITNSSGTILESHDYDPYGNITSSLSSIGNPYYFTGRRYDTESGVYYYRRRMYDPKIGRFLQRDPLEYYDSMNLYEYTWNNPIIWIDPFGLAVVVTRPIYRKIHRWNYNAYVGRHSYIRFKDGSTASLNRANGKTSVGPETKPLPPSEEAKWSKPIKKPEDELKKAVDESKKKTDPNKDDVDGQPYDSFPYGGTNNSNDWVNQICGEDLVDWDGDWK